MGPGHWLRKNMMRSGSSVIRGRVSQTKTESEAPEGRGGQGTKDEGASALAVGGNNVQAGRNRMRANAEDK